MNEFDFGDERGVVSFGDSIATPDFSGLPTEFQEAMRQVKLQNRNKKQQPIKE